MSIKVKQSLIKSFTQIQDKSFDEDTIKMLLITSREYIKQNGIVKELAHFIAHPVRNKGMCHRKINNRYAKMKLVEQQIEAKKDDEDFMQRIKTEDQLSDFMLGGISYDKIDAQLFELLYFDGIEDISESHLKKYTGDTKKQALQKIRQYYTKQDGHYYLNELNIVNELKKKIIRSPNLLELLPIDTRNEIDDYFTSSEEVKNYSTKIKKQLDELQKVIRGTIEYKSIFTSKDLKKEIITVLTEIIVSFKMDNSFVKSIKENIDDIELCIMTLLHDSRFIFYDEVTADTRLCFYVDEMPLLQMPSEERHKANYTKGVIALYVSHHRTGGGEMSYPLYVSDLKISKYYTTENNSIETDIIRGAIPWTTAKRVNGKLRLVTNDLL